MGRTLSNEKSAGTAIVSGTTQLVGQVVDLETNQPLAGAKVRATSTSDPSKVSETTADGNGLFSLAAEAGPVSLVAEAEGYSAQVQSFDASETSASLQLKVRPIAFVQQIDVAADSKSLEVKVPDNSGVVEISDPAKALGVTGPVRAEITIGDPRQNPDAFPGGFSALQGVRGGVRGSSKRALMRQSDGSAEDSVQLASVVFGDITLRGPSGEEISQLKSPAKVKMKIPPGTLNPDTSAPFKVGDKIPMWYIDESLGTWVAEIGDDGKQVEATAVAGEDGALFMEFSAKHFTAWNVDMPIKSHHCLKGRVVDACKMPKKGVHVCAFGTNYSGSACNGATLKKYWASAPVGDDGRFCVDVMKGKSVELKVGADQYALNWNPLAKAAHSASAAPASCEESASACTEVPDIAIVIPKQRLVKGIALDDEGNPVPGAMIYATGQIATAYADSNGAFSLSLLPGDSIELTVSPGHASPKKFPAITHLVTVPGFTPAPGSCEDAPAVELGKLRPKKREIGCLRGKITDESQKPLKNAGVRVGSTYVTSDEGGNYCVDALPGDLNVWLNYYDQKKSNWKSKSQQIKVVGGGSCGGGQTRCVMADISIEIGGDSCVSGKVTDQNGNPVKWAAVQSGSQMTSTDANGNYCLAVPPKKKVKVKVRHYGVGKGGGGSVSEADEEVESSGPAECGSCVVVNKTLQINQPPTVGDLSLPKKIVAPSETVTVSVTASDPDGDKLSFDWLASDGKLEKVRTEPPGKKKAPSALKGDDPQVAWTAPQQSGKFNISVVVEDQKKATAMADAEVQVGEDKDGDGFVGGSGAGLDCNDTNAKANPKGLEVCDGADNDCNGKSDDVPQSTISYKDADGDGYTDGGFVKGCAPAAGYVASAKPGDCDDGNKAKFPGNVEVCDNLDNNCDGKVDEGLGGSSCTASAPGVCAAGTMKCSIGVLACVSNVTPSAETCDGVDNNCDGKVDENTGGSLCLTGKSGLCSGGIQQCQGGALVCVQTTPAAASEACGDGIDNNCDGKIDDVCQCTNGTTQACYSGPSGSNTIGTCKAGSQTCSGGLWGTCTGEVLPATEICDGLDNDCNGTVDNGIAAGGNCTTAQPGVCAAGTQQCQSGTTVCVANTSASTELCDNLDNDCDAATDETFTNKGQACTAGQGACLANGTFVCKADGTATQCSATAGTPATEICDSIDNDCDGSTDEGVCPPAAPSGLTATAVSSTQINLAWTDNSTNEDGFKVEQKIGAGGTFALLTTAPANSTSMGIGGLSPSTTYYYRLYAYTGTNNSSYSNEANATTSSASGSGIVQMISAKGYHACVLVSDGTVKCWGRNQSGEVGDGSTNNRAIPTGVSSLSAAIAVSAGGYHSCALRADSTLQCWGSNGAGELGDGTTMLRKTPVTVTSLTAAVQATGGEYSTCALTAAGTVKCWGYNSYGQLGDGTTANRAVPGTVSGLTGVVQLSQGQDHACALLIDGSVRCWGENGNGTLGDGTTSNKSTPVSVAFLSGATEIVLGYDHSCALLSDGSAKCWGDNFEGQIGDGTTTGKTTPVAVSALTGALTLAASLNTTCALISDGRVKCWGRNAEGQIGDGTTLKKVTPVLVSSLTAASSVSAGFFHVCSRLADGTLRCWGRNGYGELGDGTTYNKSTPVAVTSLTGPVGVKLPRLHEGSAGRGGPARPWREGLTNHLGAHNCVLLSDGTVKCWGFNFYGGIGNGTTATQMTPVAVSSLSNAVAVAGGYYHTCALLSDGSVKCWGADANGQLGDGSTADKWTPVPVGLLSGAVGIAGGRSHTCSLLSNGSVKCWGANGSGQLGDGTSTNKPTSITVSSLSNAVAVAGGSYHTCALLSDGRVRCWGWNTYGQLGDGSLIDRNTPVAVSTLSDAVAVSGGDSHTCSLLSDGSARCWGYNFYGQLGDGTATLKSIPVAVVSFSNGVSVTAGYNHTCALLSDGTARCWGYNSDGQVGDGATLNRSTPVAVSFLSNASAVSGGVYHTCALLPNGSVKCWGWNAWGQLGDGTTINRLTPVNVINLP